MTSSELDHTYRLTEDDRKFLIEGFKNEYDPLKPSNFNDLHHELISSQQIRVMKKRHRRTAAANAAALLQSKNEGASDNSVQKEDVAFKIMNKYGFKHGEGLGKSKQGITTPLYVKKTGRTIGKIIDETALNQNHDMPPESHLAANSNNSSATTSNSQSEYSNADLMKNPSRCIVLRNMVNADEIDQQLEAELSSECQKFGTITSLYIHQNQTMKEDVDKIRIFVVYDSINSAIKALISLNRRFFGGKIVNCRFYDFSNYQKKNFDDLIK
ncbi:MAG: Splicing factor 45 [Marteilia pararefringens]